MTIQRQRKPYVYTPMRTFDVQVDPPTGEGENIKHGPYENIWMTCRRVPVQMVFDYEDMLYRKQIPWFCEHVLISWNVEQIKTLEDGSKIQEPVQPTEEGMKELEHPMILAILNAWYSAVLRPDENLESAS